jgi:adenylate cyclase
VPSLGIEALRVAQGASTLIVRSSNASGQTAFGQRTGVNTLKVGDFEIPTDAQGELRVHFSPSEPRRFIPIWKLLSGDVDRGEIQDRIVIVGTSAAGLRDQRATPIDSSVAGVEIHAQVVEQIVSGAWLTRPDWAPGAELLLAIVLPLSIGMLLPRISALSGAIVTPLAVGLVVWTSRYSFTAHGLLLDPVIPGLAVVATYVSCVIWLYRAEQHRRRFVHEAFGRYVAPAVVDRLTRDPSRFVLGGEMRTLTIMFCDVRGFSSIAERLDAQGLAQFMNEYLTAMTDAVLAQGGTIDKYIGDAVMAFWNAPLDDPDHAQNATLAAWAMVRELERLNEQWKRRADERGEPHSEVGFRIGLATGECCVGNFGSNHRFDYSVLGDDVNLASRLEGANKFYHTRILASDATRDLAAGLPWLEVDNVRVKGKSRATRVFTLAGPAIERQSPQFARPCVVARQDAGGLSARRFRGRGPACAARLTTPHRLAARSVRRSTSGAATNWRERGRTNWAPVTDLEKL